MFSGKGGRWNTDTAYLPLTSYLYHILFFLITITNASSYDRPASIMCKSFYKYFNLLTDFNPVILAEII